MICCEFDKVQFSASKCSLPMLLHYVKFYCRENDVDPAKYPTLYRERLHCYGCVLLAQSSGNEFGYLAGSTSFSPQFHFSNPSECATQLLKVALFGSESMIIIINYGYSNLTPVCFCRSQILILLHNEQIK